ncbi:PREDICTED: cleavage stimulation factor subunit 50-like [Camelina sativa]|uniref:Cleavage stimulation factor 50 kDa subunit n=1 Tax=Camelina sativa TaxID=90675 RepID=A0ABM1Q765_CAMSA|nr:PREDICTED: cleavage stimulation factor subunit 50-like [Camelina sativa]
MQVGSMIEKGREAYLVTISMPESVGQSTISGIQFSRAIRLYDGVSAKCIRSISGAHGKSEVTSAVFTKDQRFVLSSGKDFAVKLWEIGSGQMVKECLGAKRIKLRSQAIFNESEEFVISIDEANNEVVTWDARTAEKVAKWPSNHNSTPQWIEHSPVESVFVTCGTDISIRFWKESV